MKRLVLLIIALAIAAGVIYMTQSKNVMSGMTTPAATTDNNSGNSDFAPQSTDSMTPPPASSSDTSSNASAMSNATSDAQQQAAPASSGDSSMQQAAPATSTDGSMQEAPASSTDSSMEQATPAVQSAEQQAIDNAASAGAAASNPENSAQTTK